MHAFPPRPLAPLEPHSENDPSGVASMPFAIRQFRRLPACCPLTYQRGLNEGSGTVWNLSVSGFRVSGDLP